MAFSGPARAITYGPHTGIFSIVLQWKRARGRTGHIIMISLSYHENRKQPTSSYETVTQCTSLARMASETLQLNLVYVLNKAAEISIIVLCFFFSVISEGFFHREPFYLLCRFRDRRTVNKTACSIIWQALSKFILSLGYEFSRHPRGLNL